MGLLVVHRWDAKTYDSLPLPHTRWGAGVLSRLSLRGNETVLDAGAGTGRDTENLLARLPDGHVVAVDGSDTMLERLAARLGDDPRLRVIHGDLTTPLPVGDDLDAAISVATFHWIHDHEAVFENVASYLRPGAVFVAECGGEGNVATIGAIAVEVLGEDIAPWHFAGIADTAARLDKAGFTNIEVGLHPDPARLAAGEQFESYLATVVLGGHLQRLPAERHEEFIREVAARAPEPVVDYVRLTIRAVRG
jgi:trans-aconitate 2-methyltransferase